MTAPASDVVALSDHVAIGIAGDRVAALEHPPRVERPHDRLVRLEPQ